MLRKKKIIRILPWNCASVKQCQLIIEKLVCGADADALQETLQIDGEMIVAGFHSFYNKNNFEQANLVRDYMMAVEVDIS